MSGTADRDWLAGLLEQACEPLFLRLHQREAATVLDQLIDAAGDLLGSEQLDATGEALRLQGIAVAAISSAERLRAAQIDRNQNLADLHRLHEASDDGKERDLQLLRFLRDLDGAERIDPDDRRALKRWLDIGVADERVAKRNARDRVLEECHLRIIGVLLAHVFRVTQVEAAGQLLSDSRFFACMQAYLVADVPWRLGVAAAQACERVAEAIGQERWLDVFDMDCYQAIRRRCHDDQANVWVRVAAWRALQRCRPELWLEAVDGLLRIQADRDDDTIFLRRCLIDALRDTRAQRAEVILHRCIADDVSELVRQAAVRILCGRGRAAMGETVDHLLGFHTHRPDPSVPIRLQAVLGLLDHWGTPGQSAFEREWLLDRWHWVARFAIENDLLRGLLDATPDALDRLAPPAHGITEACAKVLDGLYQMRNRDELSVDLRRRVSESIEQVIVPREPFLAEILGDLRERLAGMGQGDRRQLPLPESAAGHPERLGRVLALLAQQDLGYSARVHGTLITIQRGMRFIPRFWRILHEIRNPAPDKRQGWHHGVGRCFIGPLRAHPLLVGEQSPTRVPGEPLVIEKEGQWRRHIPLLDDVIDACSFRGEAVSCYSSHGVTTIHGPERLRDRLLTRARLTWRYGRLAPLRNRLADGGPDPYLQELRRLGFRVTFTPWPAPEDSLAAHAYDEALNDHFAIPTADDTGDNEERVA